MADWQNRKRILERSAVFLKEAEQYFFVELDCKEKIRSV